MARAVSLAPQALRALAELQPLAVLPEPREQAEPQACRARRPAVFRPKQKGKRKVQQESAGFSASGGRGGCFSSESLVMSPKGVQKLHLMPSPRSTKIPRTHAQIRCKSNRNF